MAGWFDVASLFTKGQERYKLTSSGPHIHTPTHTDNQDRA